VTGEGHAAAQRGIGGELLAEGSLADTRFADDHHQPSLTREGGIEGRLELTQFLLAADEDTAVEGVVSRCLSLVFIPGFTPHPTRSRKGRG
jgi:hypothetical protein